MIKPLLLTSIYCWGFSVSIWVNRRTVSMYMSCCKFLNLYKDRGYSCLYNGMMFRLKVMERVYHGIENWPNVKIYSHHVIKLRQNVKIFSHHVMYF